MQKYPLPTLHFCTKLVELARRWSPAGASVFDSKVLCQEMSLAARRSGMLDAGLLLVSFTGEARSTGWLSFTVGQGVS